MASVTLPGGVEISRIGLSEVYKPPQDVKPAFHIVFVHGLFGSPYKTWCGISTANKKPTPCDIPHSHPERSPHSANSQYTARSQVIESRLNIRIHTRGGADGSSRSISPSQQSASSAGQAIRPEIKATKAPPFPNVEQSTTKSHKMKPVFWPADLLPSEIPEARIWTWGYDADIGRFGASAGQNTVFNHASNLLSDLADLQEQPGSNLPIIFVVHSLGGIIVKAALNQSSQTEGTRLKNIVPVVYVICFLGTPHRGSGTATLGKIAYQITIAATARPNLRLISALEKNSDVLEQIGDAFLQVQQKYKIRIYSFREEKETRRLLIFNTIVVTRSSAKIGISDEEVGNIPENHSNMTKFSSSSHVGFKRVKNQLAKWSREIASSKQVNTNASDDDCLISLDNPETRIRFKAVKEAYAETFQWLFDQSQVGFISWLKDRTKPLFWIKGKPGSGKSTLMKLAIQDERTSDLLNAGTQQWIFARFFFHDRGSNVQKSLSGMLQGLLYQILLQARDLETFVRPVYNEISSQQRTKLPSWDFDTLSRAFLAIIKQRTIGTRLCIFVDALDEHDEHDDAGNNETLIAFLHKITSSSDGDIVHIKVCLASRPWNVFMNAFDHCPGLEIHKHTKVDIEHYTLSRLRGCLSPARLLDADSENRLFALRDLVSNKAEGVFIWVRLVVEEVAQGVIDGTSLMELEALVEELPLELEDLYRRIITRIKPHYTQRSHVMLQIALCSLIPLPLETFMGSVFHAEGRALPKRDDMVRQVNGVSGGLLEAILGERETPDVVPNGEASSGLFVQFIHQTVKDYLNKTKTFKEGKSSYTFSGNYYLFHVAATCIGPWASPLIPLLFEYAKLVDEEITPEMMATSLACLEKPARPDVMEPPPGIIRGPSLQSSRHRDYLRIDKLLSMEDLRYYKRFFEGSFIGNETVRLFYLAIAADLTKYVSHKVNFHNRSDDSMDETLFSSTVVRDIALQIAMIGPRISSSDGSRAAMVAILLEMKGDINTVLSLYVSPDLETYQILETLKSNYDYTLLGLVINLDERWSELSKEDQFAIAHHLLKNGADPNRMVMKRGPESEMSRLSFPESFTNGVPRPGMIKLLYSYGLKLPDSYRLPSVSVWRRIPTERRSDIIRVLLMMAEDMESSSTRDYNTEDHAVMKLVPNTICILPRRATRLGSQYGTD